MKTAKEILNGKEYERFDLGLACKEIEKYFDEADACSKLVIQGRYFDNIRQDADFHGFFMSKNDFALTQLTDSGIKMEKLEIKNYQNIALIEVEFSCVRTLIDSLKKAEFYIKRVEQGLYTASLI